MIKAEITLKYAQKVNEPAPFYSFLSVKNQIQNRYDIESIILVKNVETNVKNLNTFDFLPLLLNNFDKFKYKVRFKNLWTKL